MTKFIPPKVKEHRIFYLQITFVVIAFVLMVALSYAFMSSIVHNNLVRNSNAVIRITETRVTSRMEEYRSSLDSAADEVRGMLLRGDSEEAIREYVDGLSQFARYYGGTGTGIQFFCVSVESPAGGVVMINGGETSHAGQDPLGMDWYRMAVDAGGETIETTPGLNEDGEIHFTFAKSLLDESGGQIAVVSMDVLLNMTGQDVVNTALDQGGYGMLLNQELMVMFHPNKEFTGIYVGDPAFPVTALEDGLRKGEEITEQYMYSYLDERSVAFFHRLPNGWYLGLVTPEAQFYSSTSTMAFGLILLGTILAVVLIGFLVRMENERSRSDNENKQKSMFLANMSHEIRTPLNVIVGLSELALDGDWLEDETEDKLEKIHASGMLILSIVNDILDISKLQSGKFTIYPIQYDTPSLINDIVTLNIVRIGDKPIKFQLHVDESLPGILFGDDLRLKQIFNNLLSNAFKYTDSGNVDWRLTFEREGDTVWLVSDVQDTGIGIKPENLKELFSDYQQVDMKANRKVEGTGLGLVIAKNLVEMMDGTITVESEYEKGTTFHVRLKQKLVSDAAIGEEIATNLMTKNYTMSKRSRNMKLLRVNLSYARVLIVDDIATNLDVARGMMKPYSMQVDCVTSGKRAVELMRAATPRYDAIFMDHMMPGMDGVEATRIIREEIGTDYAKNIPIIALTANAILGNEEMFLSNGFQDFISKPIDMAKLDASLRRWVRDKTKELKLHDAAETAQTASALPGGKSAPPSSILGLDMEKALERFSGDQDIFYDVLRSYATNTRSLLGDLKRYLDQIDLQNYAIVVHGVKGSSYGIFAKDVGRAAEALEGASKAGDLEEVRTGHPIFSRMAAELLDRIDAAIRQYDGAHGKPLAHEPDAALLAALKAACKSFDMDGVDSAIERLDSFRYETGGALVEWLKSRVSDMLFEEIAEGEWPQG